MRYGPNVPASLSPTTRTRAGCSADGGAGAPVVDVVAGAVGTGATSAVGVGAVEAVPPLEELLEAPGQRVAEVAVAHDGVELAEVLLVGDRRLGDGPDDELHLLQCLPAHAVPASPGSWTCPA